MDAIQKADKALRVFGEIRRTRTTGGEETQAFAARIAGAISSLPLDEQYTITRIYIEGMTNEQAAGADDCDPTTVSRRKRRALSRLAMILYTDQFIREGNL